MGLGWDCLWPIGLLPESNLNGARTTSVPSRVKSYYTSHTIQERVMINYHEANYSSLCGIEKSKPWRLKRSISLLQIGILPKFKGNNCQLFRESSSYILVSLGILQTNDSMMDLQHHSACRQIKLMKICEFRWMREDFV